MAQRPPWFRLETSTVVYLTWTFSEGPSSRDDVAPGGLTHTDESSTCLSGVVRGRERLSHRPLLTQTLKFVLKSLSSGGSCRPSCHSSSKWSSNEISQMFNRKPTEKIEKATDIKRTCVEIGRESIGLHSKPDRS